MTATSPTNVPYQASRATLVRASITALAAGAAMLVLVVLPAEYGIDPTGIGGAIDLTRMAGGEDAAVPAGASAAPAAPATFAVPTQTQANIEKKTPYRSDEKRITLAPHTGIELKAMKAGDTFNFRWTSTGPLRSEMHGEPMGGKDDAFTDYWKQKDIRSAQGSFTAPFDGTHGWYWKYREDVPITLTAKLNGFYESMLERK